jgi:hypothetical protein
MTDSNPTRARYTRNKKAFDDVLGDPFALEDIVGHYQTLKYRSPLVATKNNFGEGKATVYPGRPNALDFCMDVERVMTEVIGDDEYLMNMFLQHYIFGVSEGDEFYYLISPAHVRYIEQRMGRLFVLKGLSPVPKYFAVTKMRSS